MKVDESYFPVVKFFSSSEISMVLEISVEIQWTNRYHFRNVKNAKNVVFDRFSEILNFKNRFSQQMLTKYQKYFCGSIRNLLLSILFFLNHIPFETLPEFSEGYVVDPPQKREKWPFPATSNVSKIFLKRDINA